MSDRVRAFAFPALVCLALSFLFVAPWVPNEETVPTVYSPAVERFARIDISMWTYLLTWGARHPDRFYDGNILVPLKNALASNDYRMTEGLWSIPLFRLLPPLTAWGVCILIALWVTSWAAWLAGRWLTGSHWGGAATAVLFGFGLFRANHVVHIEGLFNPFLAASLVAMAAWFERPTRRRGVFCAILLTAAMLEYSYLAVTLGLVAPPVFLFAVLRRKIAPLRAFAPLAAAFLSVGLLLLPVATIYLAHHAETELTRSLRENDFGSADHLTWLTAPSGQVLPPFGQRRMTHPDDQMFPGAALLLLGLAGLPLLWKRSPELALCGLLGFLLSFGTGRLLWWRLGLPHLDMSTPYEILYELLLPLKAVRSPARHGVLAHLILAFSASLLIRSFAMTRRRGVIAALLLAAAFLEARHGMHEMTLLPGQASDPAYQMIASRDVDFAVLEIPMGAQTSLTGEYPEFEHLFTALRHGRPTPNGSMGLILPWHESLAVHFARPRSDETPMILRAAGIRHVVSHDPESTRSWRKIGLTLIHESPSGIAILEVDSPMSVPRTPAELQGRLFGLPHDHYAKGDVALLGAIRSSAVVRVRAGEPYNFPVVVENRGDSTWCANGRIFGLGPRGDLCIGISRWHGSRVNWPQDLRGDDLTAFGLLPCDLAPGETVTVWIRGRAPVRVGEYGFDLDFIPAKEEWLHPPDSAPARSRLIVEPMTQPLWRMEGADWDGKNMENKG